MCEEDDFPLEKVVEVLGRRDNGHNHIFPLQSTSGWRRRSEVEMGTTVREKESRRVEDVHESE